MNNWRKVRPASATFCSKTRGVLYLRVGTSSSMVRQAERGNSTISFISWGDLRRSVIKEIPDRKSTRLNSSHLGISYAVFCLKKKKKKISHRTKQGHNSTCSRILDTY